MTKDELSLQRYRYLARFMHGHGESPGDENWEKDVHIFNSTPVNLAKHLPSSQYTNLLNMGGSLREARIFTKLGYDCTTVGMVPSLEIQLKNVGFKIVCNDLCEMNDIDNESYDGVVSIQCLEHVFYPWKAFLEIYRVLKKGGRAVINVPVWFKDQENVNVPHPEVATLQHCSVLQPYQMRFMIRQCGFKLIDQFVVEHQQTVVAEKMSYEELASWPHTKEWPTGVDVYYCERLANFLRGYCEHPAEIKGENAPSYAPEWYQDKEK
jgi:SAM-dependent methyltransferase